MKQTHVTFCKKQFTYVFERKAAGQAAAACLAVVQKPPPNLRSTFGDAVVAAEGSGAVLKPTGGRDLKLAVSLCFAFYLETKVGECSVADRIQAMADMGVPPAYAKLADPRIRRHIALKP